MLENILTHFSLLIGMLKLRFSLSQVSSAGHEEKQTFSEGKSASFQWVDCLIVPLSIKEVSPRHQ